MTILIEEKVLIPEGIADLASFRRWAHSPDFPRDGRFSFLDGSLWIDMSPEHLLKHNQVKGEFAVALGGLLKTFRLGRFFHDRTLLTHVGAGLSNEPDGTFVSFDAFRSGRVRFVEGPEKSVELEGSPDMVLEVVSPNSVRKDTVVLRRLYAKAGIPEYWLVDARGATVRFDLFQLGRAGYAAVAKRSGWVRSAVFDRSFHLSARPDELGYAEYTLAIR